MSSGAPNSRRGFFRQMIAGVAERVDLLPAQAKLLATQAEPKAARAQEAPRPLPVRPITTTLSRADAIQKAQDLGLGSHLGAVRDHLAASVRLTTPAPADNAGWRTCLMSAAEGADSGLTLVLDLAEVKNALGEEVPSPGHGALWVDWRPATSDSAYSDDVRVSWRSASGDRVRTRVPLQVSRELQLPRVWAETVQALGLDDAEEEAWEALRSYIVTAQGAELEGDLQDLELHRALGYPDERRGDMPLACELLAQGYDLAEDPPALHPRARDLELPARRWRLLFQLSLGSSLEPPDGDDTRRLYLWIDAEDLLRGEYTRVRAIRQ